MAKGSASDSKLIKAEDNSKERETRLLSKGARILFIFVSLNPLCGKASFAARKPLLKLLFFAMVIKYTANQNKA
jgi:hypothetical protein